MYMHLSENQEEQKEINQKGKKKRQKGKSLYWLAIVA